MRKSVFAICVIAALLVAGGVAANDWQKLGKKTVAFGADEKTTSIKAKGDAVSEFAFRIGGDWVLLTQVTLNFDDGSNQIIKEVEKVRPGMTSGGIAIDAGPKTITSIDLNFKSAAASGGGRATVTALGQ